ncbi:polyglutamine-binding protein 1 [Copidosoma floridanum]|uniref:polyglutamine-binding protein 1 n=1 Tax=Copidosoma floridanum TaxID=29053 RepID=UPI0006C9D9F7|nr:polyglutamine-binding protein 1 [Copidosoma floridanum]
MPLPAALAARLAKRGLIGSKKNEANKDESKKRVHEEIIAEDYDNSKDDIQLDIAQKFMGYPGCPNKYNIYHDCSKKCKELWGKGHTQPTERYLKRQLKIMKKYPLPETWKAIFDAGTGRHYYWDWSSDLVAWFPPGHPKCQISQPASQLREERHLKEAEKDDNVSSEESGSEQEVEEEEEPQAKRDRKDNREKEYRDKYRPNMDTRRYQKYDKGKNDKKDRTLDPMDPAAYSDIPRGKWSDGLARQNEAKTGADTTAAGPLYQMRPYPSPGAVLRSNKPGKGDDSSGKSKAYESDED